MTAEVLIAGPLPPAAEAGLEACRLHRLWQAPDREAFLGEVGPRVEAIATDGGLGADAALIAACPKLKVIGCCGVGYDAVDVAAAAARGVVVTNTPDVLNDEVADLAMALMLAVGRRLVAADRFVRAGRWPKGAFPLASKVSGRKLGILGLGRIGKTLARRAEAFDMGIGYHGRHEQAGVPHRYFATPTELAAWADVLTVIVPGGGGTRHLVDRAVLDALGPEGVLINVARGSAVDEAALVDALVEGRLGGAGLDVFADEPNAPEALFGLDTVVLLPHVGSATHETRAAMGRLTADNIVAVLEGRPPLTPVPAP